MSDEKRIVHCWADGPRDEEGCGSTCMLEDGHDGAHEFLRDSEIVVTFKEPPKQ